MSRGKMEISEKVAPRVKLESVAVLQFEGWNHAQEQRDPPQKNRRSICHEKSLTKLKGLVRLGGEPGYVGM